MYFLACFCQLVSFLEGIFITVRVVLPLMSVVILSLSQNLKAAGIPESNFTFVYTEVGWEGRGELADNIMVDIQDDFEEKNGVNAILLKYAMQSAGVNRVILTETDVVMIVYRSDPDSKERKLIQVEGLYTCSDVSRNLKMDKLAEAVDCASTLNKESPETICIPSFTAEKFLVRLAPENHGQAGNDSAPECSSSSSGEAHSQYQSLLPQSSSVHTSRASALSSGDGEEPPEERQGEPLPSSHLVEANLDQARLLAGQTDETVQAELAALQEGERRMREAERRDLLSDSGTGWVATYQNIRMHGSTSSQQIRVIAVANPEDEEE